MAKQGKADVARALREALAWVTLHEIDVACEYSPVIGGIGKSDLRALRDGKHLGKTKGGRETARVIDQALRKLEPVIRERQRLRVAVIETLRRKPAAISGRQLAKLSHSTHARLWQHQAHAERVSERTARNILAGLDELARQAHEAGQPIREALGLEPPTPKPTPQGRRGK